MTEQKSVSRRTMLFLWLLILSPLSLLAQTGPSTGNGPTVRADKKHDVSPPLRNLPPFVPKGEPLRAIPVRPTHAPSNKASGTAQDLAHQRLAQPPVQATFGVDFEGIGQGQYGFNLTGAPPDTNGAVGPTQYVQAVNASFAVFDKTTGNVLLGATDFRTIYNGFGGPCETNSGSDPVVLYDKLANRWVLQLLTSDSDNDQVICFAVSTSSDATGSFNRYVIPFGSVLQDYDKLSIWSDAYYFSANQFDLSQGGAFIGPNACAINRLAAINGQPLQIVCFTLDPSFGSLLSSDMDGTSLPPPGEPAFYATLGNDNASLDLFKFHVDFSQPNNSAITGPVVIPVASFNPLCGGFGSCVPQVGSPQFLDSLADRLMFRLAYRNFGDHESLLVNHSVEANSRSGVRWYEIRNPNGSPVIFQQGTFAPDSNWRWMGSIASDKFGDIALGYSVSGPTLHPSIAVTARTPSDPLGTLESEIITFNGAGSQTPDLNRWGDYSAMVVDPVDDCTFWYTTEYIPSNGAFNWHTRIASFQLPGCGTITSTAPAAAARPLNLDFDSTLLPATSSVQFVFLTNDGPGNLSIGNISTTGDFAAIANNCGTFLGPHSSCTINIDFKPTGLGLRTGSLTITDSSINGPHVVGLSGVGVSPTGQGLVNDFNNGFPSPPGLSLNNGASITLSGRLRLTDGGNSEARSVFFTTPMNVASFTNDYTFQLTNATADGFTFTIQNNNPTIVGGAGGSLGYEGIPASVAVKFDLFNNAGEGFDSTGLYTNGASPTLPSVDLSSTGINLHSGDLFKVHMTYDGTTLTWTITDTNTGATFTTSAPVNIPAIVGGPAAFVGFTAGTGGLSAIQEIPTWGFQTPSNSINFSNGFPPPKLSLNGNATLLNGRLRLTDGGNGEASSAFILVPVNVGKFTNDFTFQNTNAIADGFAFVIQNAGLTALGQSGGGLGYAADSPDTPLGIGIGNSVAVKFDLFDNAGEGFDSTGAYTGGVSPTVPSVDMSSTGIDLHSNDTFRVHMTYDGKTLTWTITDTNTGARFTNSAALNVPQAVGGRTAFIGFTAGTGGLSATQEIISWTFQGVE